VDTFYALDHAATEIDIWAQYLLEVINSVAWVHERTKPTDRPPHGEVSANICG
jgi:hypothetical protein